MKPEVLEIVVRGIDAEIDGRRSMLQDEITAAQNRMAERNITHSTIAVKEVTQVCIDELNARGEIFWKITVESLAKTKSVFDDETTGQVKDLLRNKFPVDLPDLRHFINSVTNRLESSGLVKQIEALLDEALVNLLTSLDTKIDLENLASQTEALVGASDEYSFDVFICHASEDKQPLADPLAKALRDSGVNVWYDKSAIGWGDGLRRSIENGLVTSRFGIVILSPSFFKKKWPQRELDGLVSLEMDDGKKRILPVWHDIEVDEVTKNSPMMADLRSVSSSEGVDFIVSELLEQIKG